MPHGVLFRGRAEGVMRRRIIEEDLLDTVIGLGPNLFYGTGIPAAILILRAKGSKPPARRYKVLFINADRDYGEGRAQNHLRPRDEQKITAAYRGFADIDGFARVVTIDELADNEISTATSVATPTMLHHPNPTTYEPTSTAPYQWRRSTTPLTYWHEAGLDGAILFANRGDGYARWRYEVATADGRTAAHNVISQAVAARAAASSWPRWWADAVEPMLRALPESGILVGQRQRLVEEFTAHMASVGMDRFAAAGMAATWWEDCFYELETAANRGWKAVIDAWLTTAEAGVNDKNAPDLADQTAIRLLARRQLAERARQATECARLDVEIKAAETADDEERRPRR